MASLSPELIFEIGGFPITNTVISTIIVDLVIIGLIIAFTKQLSIIPKGIQRIFEPLIEYLYDTTLQIAGHKTLIIFPWFASFFLFILLTNFIGLLPGFGSIGFWEVSSVHGETIRHLVPLLRAGTSDFNLTLALGFVSVVTTHIISIHYNGFLGYLGKFLSLNPINLFIGLLEFTLELVKVFSLSMRLFGNIYAGEVVLATVGGLAAFIAPIPFLMLESIVAIVQALVFSMLTMVFMSLLATTSKESGH